MVSFFKFNCRIRQAIKKDDKGLIGTYCMQAAKILNSEQRARLPSDVKERVMKKYELIQERQKLALMGEAEKKTYLAKQAAEKKERLKQQMKERLKKLRKVRKKKCYICRFKNIKIWSKDSRSGNKVHGTYHLCTRHS